MAMWSEKLLNRSLDSYNLRHRYRYELNNFLKDANESKNNENRVDDLLEIGVFAI